MSATAKPEGKRPKNCFAAPGSPFWQYEIIIAGHKERGSTRCRKAGDAADFVAARRLSLKEELAARAAGKKMTKGPVSLQTACNRYYEDKAAQQKAADTYLAQMASLVAIMPPNTHLHDIDHALLLDYRRNRQAESKRVLAGATINREIELLRRVWRHLDDLGFECGEQPKWAKAIDRGAEVERIRDLTADEETRLMEALSAISPELCLVVEFALIAGQRKSAIMSLRRSMVDRQANRATILLKTKGEAPRPHTFPLTARACEILDAFPPVAGTDAVFTYTCRRSAPAKQGNAPRVKGQRYEFSRDGWRRDWATALKNAGIEDFKFHDLRHSAATRIIRKTGNLKIAQNLLAHTDIAQTARYAHAFHGDILAAMELVAS